MFVVLLPLFLILYPKSFNAFVTRSTTPLFACNICLALSVLLLTSCTMATGKTGTGIEEDKDAIGQLQERLVEVVVFPLELTTEEADKFVLGRTETMTVIEDACQTVAQGCWRNDNQSCVVELQTADEAQDVITEFPKIDLWGVLKVRCQAHTADDRLVRTWMRMLQETQPSAIKRPTPSPAPADSTEKDVTTRPKKKKKILRPTLPGEPGDTVWTDDDDDDSMDLGQLESILTKMGEAEIKKLNSAINRRRETLHLEPLIPSGRGQPPQDVHASFLQGATIRTHIPTLKTFSGEAPEKGKPTCNYEQWRQDVQNLRQNYSEGLVREAIFKSLTSSARSAISSLGLTPSVIAIIERMDIMFGAVSSSDVLLQSFYDLQQGSQSVAAFSIKLEESLAVLVSVDPFAVPLLKKDELLRSRLFHGCKEPLRNAVRHRFDDPRVTYPELLRFL